MSKAVSIITLNYNGRRHLPALFAALASQTWRDFELLVVDNGSTDDSPAAVEELGRATGLRVRQIRNRTNRGFAAACNQGIERSAGEYVVMLNNDTQPEPGWLEHLVTTARTDSAVGMVGAKMLFAQRPERINSAGIAVDWAGIAWDRQGGMLDDPAESSVREVFGPCGGSALYKRRMLAQIGGFDEAFFAYLEDVDLAWRARLAGWRCLYQPQARVLHAHSATAGEGSPFKSYLLGRNKVWLVVKNYANPWFARYLPAILAYDMMAMLYGLARRRDRALLHGRFAGLRRLERCRYQRTQIHRQWRDTANWTRLMQPLEGPRAVARRYVHLE